MKLTLAGAAISDVFSFTQGLLVIDEALLNRFCFGSQGLLQGENWRHF